MKKLACLVLVCLVSCKGGMKHDIKDELSQIGVVLQDKINITTESWGYNDGGTKTSYIATVSVVDSKNIADIIKRKHCFENSYVSAGDIVEMNLLHKTRKHEVACKANTGYVYEYKRPNGDLYKLYIDTVKHKLHYKHVHSLL
jgi:hypothetical protein